MKLQKSRAKGFLKAGLTVFGHLLRMLLFSVTGGKQKDLVLFDFQETKRPVGKIYLYCMLVDMVRSSSCAKLAQAHLENSMSRLIFGSRVLSRISCLEEGVDHKKIFEPPAARKNFLCPPEGSGALSLGKF